MEKGLALTAEQMIATALSRTQLDTGVRDFFGRYDLFASPTAQVLPFDAALRYPAEVAGSTSTSYLDWMRSACVLSAAGVPVMSMPAGSTEAGLPVGLQLAANHHNDMALLRYAWAFEQATHCAARAPELPATV